MTRCLATALTVIAISASGEARAYCDPAYCDPSAIDLWLASGPSVSPLVTLQNEPGAIIVTPMLRIGFFAGLPVQFELSAAFSSAVEPRAYAAAGVRLLPVSVTEVGLQRGGLPGHNLGAMGGWTTSGWYWGAVYEWLVLPEVGVVAEVQWRMHEAVLQTTPSFHLGAKFQFPVFRDGY